MDVDGREAVELFKTHQPHLVGTDGHQHAGTERLRSDGRNRKLSERVPIIAVTAYAYASDEERIMNSVASTRMYPNRSTPVSCEARSSNF